MRTTLAFVTTLGAGLIAVGCGVAAGGSGNAPGVGQTQQPLEALVPRAGCAEVDTYVRDRINAEINTYFDEVIKNITKSQYGGCYGGDYGYEDSANSGGPPPAPTA